MGFCQFNKKAFLNAHRHIHSVTKPFLIYNGNSITEHNLLVDSGNWKTIECPNSWSGTEISLAAGIKLKAIQTK